MTAPSVRRRCIAAASPLRRPVPCSQQFRADEQRELAAAERHVVPVVDRRSRGSQGPRSADCPRAPFSPAVSPLPVSISASSCMPGLCPTSISRFGSVADGHADDLQQLRRLGAVEFVGRNSTCGGGTRSFIASQAMSQVCCARTAVETSTRSGKGGCAADPAADLGGIAPAAVVETAVLVLPRRRVGLGLGMTQQHQTAHGRNLNSFSSLQINLQASPGQGDKRRIGPSKKTT